MKKLILILILFFQLFSVFSQEKEEISILKNTKNWKKEIIKFPIEWVPDLKYTGFEELRFSPNWSDPKDEQFWSLVIGWMLETKSILTLKELKYNFKSYFDGLMKPNHWSTNFPNPEVHFTKKPTKNSHDSFIGEMKFFDGLHSGKLVDVNIQLKQIFCKKKQKTLIIFRLSPKKFHHRVWGKLNEIKLNEEFCN
ncbi:MAG: hypothetical protein V3U92_17520 [Cellulophaga sp.]